MIIRNVPNHIYGDINSYTKIQIKKFETGCYNRKLEFIESIPNTLGPFQTHKTLGFVKVNYKSSTNISKAHQIIIHQKMEAGLH